MTECIFLSRWPKCKGPVSIAYQGDEVMVMCKKHMLDTQNMAKLVTKLSEDEYVKRNTASSWILWIKKFLKFDMSWVWREKDHRETYQRFARIKFVPYTNELAEKHHVAIAKKIERIKKNTRKD